MAKKNAENGYVRASALVAIAVPVIGIMSGSIYLFVNLTVAPITQDIQRLRDSARDQREQMVPRAEHVEKWVSQRDRDAELQREIEENRSQLRGIYSPNDAFRDLNLRLDKIEDKLHSKG